MNKGFTVVEIVVVLGIMVIITGIMLFNVGSEKQNSALFRSAQKLSLDLRKVENYALSSKVFKDSKVPCGWGIHFNGAGSTSYIIFADTALFTNCSDRDYKRSSSSEDLETVNLEAGVKIDNINIDNTISDVTFTPPAPIVSFGSIYGGRVNIDRIDISLINNKSSTRKITINKTGFISSP